MWQKNIKKTLFTLNLNPDKYQEITDITYPLFKKYCYKIGAEFYEITERKFPEYPPSYEKVQVYQLGQDMKNDWNIFFDCDAIIHPDTPDVTNYIPRDHCAHNATDMASMRWRYDRFLLRDGRNLGSCTWINIASDWTIELFKPLDDLTLEEVAQNIFPTHGETLTGLVPPIRLIEDYVFSRNIAKYGLKFISLLSIFNELGFPQPEFFYHLYAIPIEEKVVRMREILKSWRLV
jgi:hypothetical protein